MLLDDDSSLLVSEDASASAAPLAAQPSGMEDVDLSFDEILTPEPAAVESTPVSEPGASDESPPEDDRSLISINFDSDGPLGVEFKELDPPYIVQEIHSGGLAHGKDICSGDKLVEVSGKVVGDTEWDALVEQLKRRPMVMTFERKKLDSNAEAAGAGLFGGFAGRMRLLGGGVAQKGLGLGNAVAAAAGSAKAVAGSAAAVAGSAAAVAGSAAGTAAAKAMDLKALDAAKGAMSNISDATTSKLTTLFAEMNDDGHPLSEVNAEPDSTAAGDDGWAVDTDVTALADMAASDQSVLETSSAPAAQEPATTSSVVEEALCVDTDNSNSNGDNSLSGWECLDHEATEAATGTAEGTLDPATDTTPSDVAPADASDMATPDVGIAQQSSESGKDAGLVEAGPGLTAATSDMAAVAKAEADAAARLAELEKQHGDLKAEMASQKREASEGAAALEAKLAQMQERCTGLEADVASKADEAAAARKAAETSESGKEDLRAVHEAEMQKLRDEHASVLKKQQDSSQEEIGAAHEAQLQQLRDEHTAALQQQKESIEAQIRAEHEADCQRIRDEHTATLQQQQESIKAKDGIQEEISAAHEAELQQLRDEHTTALEKQKESIEAQIQADHDAELQRIRDEHAAALQQQQESIQTKDGSPEKLSAAHEAEMQQLRDEHAAALQKQKESIEAETKAEHDAEVQRIRDEHAAALQQQEESTQKKDGSLEEIGAAHEAELQQLRDEHTAALQKQKESIETQIKAEHDAELQRIRDEHAAALKQKESIQTKEGSEAELQQLRDEHAAAMQQQKESIESQINAERDAELQRVRDEHASALQQQQESIQAKDGSQEEMASAHEVQLQQLRDEHAAALQQQKESIESQIRAEHEAELQHIRDEHNAVLQLQKQQDSSLEDVNAAHEAELLRMREEHAAAVQHHQAEAERCGAELQGKDAEAAGLKKELEESKTRVEEMTTAATEAEQVATARYAALQAEVTKAAEAAEARCAALQAQHTETAAQSAAEVARTAEELRSVQAALKTEQDAREQDRVKVEGQLEQLRFALADKEKQLQEKVDVIARKEQEVKSMLRQLEAAGDLRSGGAQEDTDAQPIDATEAATTFEVMFALEGSLGLQFEALAAPYIVEHIHDAGVASGLSILPGDELVAVGGSSVTQAVWEDLVQLLKTRPVVARFCRDPSRQKGATSSEGGGLFSSVLNVANQSVLNVARGAAPRKSGPPEPQQDSRSELEVERLGMLLKGRDEELAEVRGQLRQREEALRLLEGGNADAGGVSALAQEREALSQQLAQLQPRLADAEKRIDSLTSERDRIGEQYAEEFRQKEEYRQQAVALTERCNSLMTQFETLRSTCQSLSLDAQQKAQMESQVQQLTLMNAQWQKAHQNLTADSEHLRLRAEESHQLRSEVDQLREYQRAYARLEERLQDAEATLESSQKEASLLKDARQNDHSTIQRLQAVVEAIQESGESEAGHLEAELLERSRENASLKRDVDEQRRRVEELLKSQQDWREAMDESRSLKAETEDLRARLAATSQEKDTLHDVVTRCVEKLEKESRERPHLVDKRMVTQMVAAYLEQRDNPKHAQEIMAKMADLLGFTSAEREQVGLNQRRKTLLEHQEPASLSDLADGFVDFLLEESETS